MARSDILTRRVGVITIVAMRTIAVRVGLATTVMAALCVATGAAPAGADRQDCRWGEPTVAAASGFAALPTVASGRPKSPVVVFYNATSGAEVLATTRTGTTSLGAASIQPKGGMRPQPIGAAQSPEGEAVVVYMQIAGSEGRVFAVRRSVRGEWQARQQLTDAGAFGYYPAVAMDSHGTAFAVWTQNADAGKNVIVGRSISARGVLGPLFTLGRGSSEFPAIAVSGRDVVVAWDEVSVGGNPVWAARSRDAGRTWSDASQVSDADAETGQTAVAMTHSGRAGVIWDQTVKPRTGAVHVIGASARRDRGWSGPVTIAGGDEMSFNGGIVSGGSDSFTLAWGTAPAYAEPGVNTVQAASGRSLDRLGAAVTLDTTDTLRYLSRVRIAANASGVSAVTWEKRWADADHHDPAVQTGLMAAVRVGHRWQPRSVVRDLAADPNFSSVGVDRSGVVTAAWASSADASNTVEFASCRSGGHR